MTSYKLDDQTFIKIGNVLLRPIKNSRTFMKQLGAMILRDTTNLIKNEGRLSPYGFQRWMDFGRGKGVQVYRNPSTDKWKRRPGTDNSKTRKYRSNSKLLKASGLFSKSWGITWLAKDRVKVGSTHQLAEKIMSNPTRQVLKFNERRYTAMKDLFNNFINKEIKF